MQWSRDEADDQPTSTDASSADALDRILQAFQQSGWEIVERTVDPTSVRITLPQFRRKLLSRIRGVDDLVIWIDGNDRVRVSTIARP